MFLVRYVVLRNCLIFILSFSLPAVLPAGPPAVLPAGPPAGPPAVPPADPPAVPPVGPPTDPPADPGVHGKICCTTWLSDFYFVILTNCFPPSQSS